MKTQSKLTIILFLSNVAIMLLFSGAIYYSLNKYSYNDFYKRLETRASISARYNFHSDRLSANALKLLKEQHLERLPKEREYLCEITDAGSISQMAEGYALPTSFLKDIYEQGRAVLKNGNTFYTGIKYPVANKTFLVIVSADNYYSSHHLSFLKNVIWAGIVLIALISITFSHYFSKRILLPLKEITHKVNQISSENIHLRLEETSDKNEISELINTFNDLLNRLETAFETQKNFISNASHEFGTPLTAIIGEADLALIKNRTTDEYREVLQNILKQSERLDQITKSLLFLAQTGYEGKRIVFATVRIDEVIWEAKEVMDNLNPDNKIYVDLGLLPEDPVKLKVNGNKGLLNMAVANILNNACKYSYNKPVMVSIASSNHEVIVIIKDKGVGIPPEEIRFIYDPFFRASNTHKFEGYGIGLPLTRNIIRLHNGTLTVNSVVNEGTMVKITLPLR